MRFLVVLIYFLLPSPVQRSAFSPLVVPPGCLVLRLLVRLFQRWTLPVFAPPSQLYIYFMQFFALLHAETGVTVPYNPLASHRTF